MTIIVISAWEDAWNDHVKSWKPTPGAARYFSATELNHSPERLRTVFEELDNPYPETVRLQCDEKFFRIIDFNKFQETGEIIVKDAHGASWQNCEVLRFEEVNGSLRYTAVVVDKREKFSGFPREAFKFVDLPYTSDQFLPNAFRHPMMIPDEIFPEYWMNI